MGGGNNKKTTVSSGFDVATQIGFTNSQKMKRSYCTPLPSRFPS